MTEGMDHDDIAYGIVDDLLTDGVEYLTIAEYVSDEGGDDDDIEKVNDAVIEYLEKLRKWL